MRVYLAPAAIAILLVWVISVAGATGWSRPVDWSLLAAAVLLLLARRLT